MRIALFYNTPSGGAKRAIFEWVRRLAANHEIDVYTLSGADHLFCDIRPFARRYRVFDFTPYRLFHRPWGRLNRLQRWRTVGDLTRLGRQIANEVNAGSYDSVFTNSCLYTFVPTLLPFLHIPAVHYLHDTFGPSFVRQFQRPYLRKFGWRLLLDRFDPLITLYTRRLETVQRQGIRQTSFLLANSLFTKWQTQRAFGVQASICYYGADSEHFRPLLELSKGDYVVSVGELSPRKGFDFVVESLGRIPPESRPKLKLACNSIQALERDYVERLAAKNGVELQVLINLNTEELVTLYNRARLCAYAPVMEPFGLVPLEAMACGTPVVGVKEGGVAESITHGYTGLLVERDSMQFAAAVQQLLSNSALAAEYGRNGRETILRRWTWEQSTASLESYLSACGSVEQNGSHLNLPTIVV